MDNLSSIRVMVVDDHKAVRQTVALSLTVYDDLDFVGEAANGLEVLQLCPALRPDVILMDLKMPDMDGVEAIALIRQQCPKVKIIALTSLGDEALKKAALEAGANAYLLKNGSLVELAAAIRAVAPAASGG